MLVRRSAWPVSGERTLVIKELITVTALECQQPPVGLEQDSLVLWALRAARECGCVCACPGGMCAPGCVHVLACECCVVVCAAWCMNVHTYG